MSGLLWRRFERLARTAPSAPALFQGETMVTLGELHRGACALAGGLARRGLGPGDRCLVWARNSPRMAEAILAVWRAGAIIALVSDEAPASHFAHAADVAQPALALVDEALADAAERAFGGPVLVLGEPPPHEAAAPPAQVHDHEPASIFFTSGSTGRPKGVTQSHATLAAACAMVGDHLGLRTSDRILCPIPWSFDYGYGQLLSTLLLGVSQVLPEARNPFALCAAIEAHRPTVFAGLPSILALLIRGVSPLRETDLSSIRLLMNTGGAIPPAIFAEALELFAGAAVSLNYGMTETYRSAGLPPELARERPGSVGFAYPGVGLSVVRQDGSACEPGEVGEIVHRGTGAFMGYWGDAEATAQVLRPDPAWRHAGAKAPPAVFSGDLGWKDEQGFLTIKGRRDRLIKSMGVRVSPDEIEGLIRGSGLVRDAAVVGLPHELMGEKVCAAVVAPEEAPDPIPQLKAFAREAMSPHMQPREYRRLDQLPLTPNGKTDFQRLRELFSQARPHVRA
jgi:acyl-CoA synthetase (AMP-forming)/AMP-acid ligase II